MDAEGEIEDDDLIEKVYSPADQISDRSGSNLPASPFLRHQQQQHQQRLLLEKLKTIAISCNRPLFLHLAVSLIYRGRAIQVPLQQPTLCLAGLRCWLRELSRRSTHTSSLSVEDDDSSVIDLADLRIRLLLVPITFLLPWELSKRLDYNYLDELVAAVPASDVVGSVSDASDNEGVLESRRPAALGRDGNCSLVTEMDNPVNQALNGITIRRLGGPLTKNPPEATSFAFSSVEAEADIFPPITSGCQSTDLNAYWPDADWLDDLQVSGLQSCLCELAWLMRDEVVCSLRQLPPYLDTTLEYVLDHLEDTKTRLSTPSWVIGQSLPFSTFNAPVNVLNASGRLAPSDIHNLSLGLFNSQPPCSGLADICFSKNQSLLSLSRPAMTPEAVETPNRPMNGFLCTSSLPHQWPPVQFWPFPVNRGPSAIVGGLSELAVGITSERVLLHFVLPGDESMRLFVDRLETLSFGFPPSSACLQRLGDWYFFRLLTPFELEETQCQKSVGAMPPEVIISPNVRSKRRKPKEKNRSSGQIFGNQGWFLQPMNFVSVTQNDLAQPKDSDFTGSIFSQSHDHEISSPTPSVPEPSSHNHTQPHLEDCIRKEYSTLILDQDKAAEWCSKDRDSTESSFTGLVETIADAEQKEVEEEEEDALAEESDSSNGHDNDAADDEEDEDEEEEAEMVEHEAAASHAASKSGRYSTNTLNGQVTDSPLQIICLPPRLRHGSIQPLFFSNGNCISATACDRSWPALDESRLAANMQLLTPAGSLFYRLPDYWLILRISQTGVSIFVHHTDSHRDAFDYRATEANFDSGQSSVLNERDQPMDAGFSKPLANTASPHSNQVRGCPACLLFRRVVSDLHGLLHYVNQSMLLRQLSCELKCSDLLETTNEVIPTGPSLAGGRRGDAGSAKSSAKLTNQRLTSTKLQTSREFSDHESSEVNPSVDDLATRQSIMALQHNRPSSSSPQSSSRLALASGTVRRPSFEADSDEDTGLGFQRSLALGAISCPTSVMSSSRRRRRAGLRNRDIVSSFCKAPARGLPKSGPTACSSGRILASPPPTTELYHHSISSSGLGPISNYPGHLMPMPHLLVREHVPQIPVHPRHWPPCATSSSLLKPRIAGHLNYVSSRPDASELAGFDAVYDKESFLFRHPSTQAFRPGSFACPVQLKVEFRLHPRLLTLAPLASGSTISATSGGSGAASSNNLGGASVFVAASMTPSIGAACSSMTSRVEENSQQHRTCFVIPLLQSKLENFKVSNRRNMFVLPDEPAGTSEGGNSGKADKQGTEKRPPILQSFFSSTKPCLDRSRSVGPRIFYMFLREIVVDRFSLPSLSTATSLIGIEPDTSLPFTNPINKHDPNEKHILSTPHPESFRSSDTTGAQAFLSNPLPIAHHPQKSISGRLIPPVRYSDKSSNSAQIDRQVLLQVALHGVEPPSKHLYVRLHDTLQTWLDGLVMTLFANSLSRNAITYLSREDIDFLTNRRGKRPQMEFSIVLPQFPLPSSPVSPKSGLSTLRWRRKQPCFVDSHCGHLLAFSYYLKQMLSLFLSPVLVRPDAMLAFELNGPHECFLYHQKCAQGVSKHGVALVLVQLVQAFKYYRDPVTITQWLLPQPLIEHLRSSNSLNISSNCSTNDWSECEDSRLSGTDSRPNLNRLRQISARLVTFGRSTSEAPRRGQQLLVTFRLWERGEVDLSILQSKLYSAAHQAMTDFLTEFIVLTTPLYLHSSFDFSPSCLSCPIKDDAPVDHEEQNHHLQASQKELELDPYFPKVVLPWLKEGVAMEHPLFQSREAHFSSQVGGLDSFLHELLRQLEAIVAPPSSVLLPTASCATTGVIRTAASAATTTPFAAQQQTQHPMTSNNTLLPGQCGISSTGPRTIPLQP
ncbi:unnamed protein product, partial [Protopolystoma xenopodis]